MYDTFYMTSAGAACQSCIDHEPDVQNNDVYARVPWNQHEMCVYCGEEHPVEVAEMERFEILMGEEK